MWISAIIPIALALMLPGPDTFLVIKNSRSTKSIVLTILGIQAGILTHMAASLFLWENSSQLGGGVQMFMNIFLSFFLFYMGYKIFNSDFSLDSSEVGGANNSISSNFLQGYVVNVCNPKALVFFLGIFQNTLSGMSYFGMSTVIMSTLVLSGGWFFTVGKGWRRIMASRYVSIAQFLPKTLAIMLIGIALKSSLEVISMAKDLLT